MKIKNGLIAIGISIAICLLAIIPMTNCQESIDDLKEQHHKECDDPLHKHYSKLTLAYVTPWKKNGYELIKKYYNKFDIISPVWFELKPERNNDNNEVNIKIDGANYIDNDFIKDIRNKNSNIKIMPRFHCDDFSLENYINWFSKPTFNQFLKILLRRLKYNKFDGIVIDCNNIWLAEDSYVALAKAIPDLYQALSSIGMKVIFTLFPYTDTLSVVVNQKRFEFLAKYVDYFNIMTYDYLQYHKDKPNNYIAPLTWINQSISYYIDMNAVNKDPLLGKMLMGIPFHGYALSKKNNQGGTMIDNDSFGALLNNERKPSLLWNEKECEHQIELKNEYIAAYPTIRFIKERLELSHLLNIAGNAIWDVGNGNELFMDEF